MKLSTLPFLFAALLIFMAAITRRAVRLHYLRPKSAKIVYKLLVALALWTIASSILAIQGFYASANFYALLPGLWMPFIPVILCTIPFVISSHFRETLEKIINCTPLHWFVYLQALRIAALGTLYKTLTGHFPIYLEIAIGIPDLIFGFSAFYIAKRVTSNTIGWKGLAIWNLIGAGIIIIPGEILIQMGLPGVLQVFSTPPKAAVLFEFPLVIAPTVVVPLLVVMNGLVAWWLFKTRSVYFSNKKATTVFLDFPVMKRK